MDSSSKGRSQRGRRGWNPAYPRKVRSAGHYHHLIAGDLAILSHLHNYMMIGIITMQPAGIEPPSLQQSPTGHDAYMFRPSFSGTRCSPGGSFIALQPSPCPCGRRSQPSQLRTSPFAHHSAVDWPRRRCDYRMPPHIPALRAYAAMKSVS